jgi:EAL domain-containing protein (putative c-di-GMP-specific phosphodiesterase class I)
MFVNLDHAYLIEVPDDLLLEAQARHALRFEINEKDVPGDGFAGLCEKINRLSAKGVRFAVDDFGSGRDGLSRVFALDKVECIKVDGALFQAAYRRHHARAALSSMVAHWNAAGILTIAEWIESEALLAFAIETGFAMGQGFYVDELRRREACACADLAMASATAGEE